MATITKCIDIRLTDYEVDIELDASDLEDFDGDELYEAMQEHVENSTIADFVVNDDDVLPLVLSSVTAEQLHEHVPADTLADAIDKGDCALDTDTLIRAFDAFNDIQKRSVVNHITETWLTQTDERKRIVCGWLGYDVENGSMQPNAAQQTLGQFTREVLGTETGRLDIVTADLDDVITTMRARSEPLSRILQAMCQSYGAAYLLGQAVEVAMQQCVAKTS